MTFIHRSAVLIAAMACGAPVTADVTAQQVWDNWTTQMDTLGQAFTAADETMSGDTLTVTDVRIETTSDEATTTAALGDIALTENGDGTVTVTFAESYPVILSLTPEFEDPSTVAMTVTQDDLRVIVSGDPDAMMYDVTAARYAISVASLDGQADKELILDDATFALVDVSGRYSVQTDNLVRTAYAFSAGALDIDVALREPGGAGALNFNGDIANVSMFANMAGPVDMPMNTEHPPFADGLAIDAGYAFGDLQYVFDFSSTDGNVAGSARAAGGNVDMAFDYDGFAFSGETRGVDINLAVPDEFPFPIEASVAKYGYDFQIPLSQGATGPRDARMAFNVTELAISNALWNLIDPQEILPRDAITVALGLDAKVTPFFDFLDPAQQDAARMSDTPGEVNSAQITELAIKGGGADVSGTGAFTFDNTDMTTFDGFPRPEGRMTFAINGANALIDNLVQMGLIPQEEAMMPRLMMGMFATTVGDDMLTSTIEVNADGHVIANGQRLH